MEIILQSPVVSPARLVRSIEKDVNLLPVLWPMLTESIKFAGAQIAAGGKPVLWVNRVLDVCLLHSPYLLEATKRGYIPRGEWAGLDDIAGARVKSMAVGKAAALKAQWECH